MPKARALGPESRRRPRRCNIATESQLQQPKASFEQARRLAIEAARLAAHTRCHNVVVLDVSGLSPVTDFFVLATGTSPIQMRSVANEVVELAEGQGSRPLSASGFESESWMLVDFVDVVVHIFSADARAFYDLDTLWGDAKRVDWQAQG